jgi:PAS domain S-box-containing protein
MAPDKNLRTWNEEILLVDDSIDNLQVLSEILTEGGYQVRPAEKPQIALESALARPPSLILLDVKMPEMSGIEVCARLKQDERTRDIPIIFVSALQDVESKVRGFTAGGVDFISKPFQESEVLARVKTHLQLRNTQLHLEQLVAERTTELVLTNEILQTEIADRKQAEQEREASWHLLRLVIDNVPALVSYVDKRQHYRFVNRRYEQVYGISQSEFVDKHVQEMLGPEGYAAAEQHIAAVLAGDGVSYEEAFHYPDIGQRWMRIEYVPDRDHAGIVQGFIGFVSDITERKQLEKALEESEEKFKTLVTNTEEIVYMIAIDGTFLLSEGKGLSKIGLKPGEVVGKSVFELYKDYPDMLDAMRNTFNGETVSIEVNVDGNYFRNWYTPHINPEGEIIGLLGLSVNITERKRAEEVLKAELAYHREDLSVLVQRQSLAVKISSFGIWDWDIKENSMTWDNKLFEIYGIEKKSPMPYEDWVHLIHPDDLPDVEAIIRTVIETKSEVFLDFRIFRPDGELRYINSAGTVVLNDAGEVVKVIGINQDITERKQAEDTLQESERLMRTIADNYPAFLSIITKDELDLIIGFTSGKEFNRLNLDPESFVGKTLEEVFGDQASIVRENYLRAFMGEDVSFELFINDQNQLYNASPLIDKNGVIDRILVVVENIDDRKLLEAQIKQSAAMAERDRLASDLHDAVTQTLFSASVIAEATPRIWLKNPVMAQQNMENLTVMLRGALAEMRTLLLELRPSALREQTLEQLLQTQVEAVRARINAPVFLVVNGKCALPEDVTITFHRIAQESLNNIVNHAEATEVSITLDYNQNGVVLDVRDNGRGFDPSTTPSGHFGLSIMAERIEKIGGTFFINSKPGDGTQIVVSWSE